MFTFSWVVLYQSNGWIKPDYLGAMGRVLGRSPDGSPHGRSSQSDLSVAAPSAETSAGSGAYR
ncbi:MAG: hypothetical protein AAF685_15255 [Cyanobacteria bacterium P01_C01_bin.89]